MTGQSNGAIWMTASAIAEVTGGQVDRSGAADPAVGVSTDTRSLRPGQLFVALRGPRFDANLFAQQALAAGAAGVLVDRPLTGPSDHSRGFVVRVDDCKRTLQAIASEHRDRVAAGVIGITGSCGKTTTKDLCAAALRTAGPTVAARGSFNNQIGLPVTLCEIEARTRFAVCELGTSAPGEIERLARLARPDIGVLTCVREAHLEGLGSLEGIAEEKSRLFAHLQPDGVAVLDADDPFCVRIAADLDRPVRLVSTEREADLFASEIRFDGEGLRFLAHGEGFDSTEVFVPRSARHDVKNALFALQVGRLCGVATSQLVRGLADAAPTPRRLEMRRAQGLRVLDDSWNMSPSSALAALRTLDDVAGGAHRVVVFGDMRELGDKSAERHRELGERAAEHAPRLLVTVGQEAHRIAQSAISSGLSAGQVIATNTATEAFDALADRLEGGEVVLCKASRGIGLDRLVDRLVGESWPRAQKAQVSARAAAGEI
ncbi:MAG: UDP-N-acetylmuramoyl-tripeptide--D-alanyl-D-alanine ligase [Planctomycetota bacterium]